MIKAYIYKIKRVVAMNISKFNSQEPLQSLVGLIGLFCLLICPILKESFNFHIEDWD